MRRKGGMSPHSRVISETAKDDENEACASVCDEQARDAEKLLKHRAEIRKPNGHKSPDDTPTLRQPVAAYDEELVSQAVRAADDALVRGRAEGARDLARKIRARRART